MTTVLAAPPSAFMWLQVLHRPEVASGWSLAEWDRVVRLSRRLRLLARIAERLDAAGLSSRVPAPVRRHLIAEHRLSIWRTQAMLWALQRIEAVLDGADYPLVLLKGAAYLGQDLPIAAGRLPSDLDILVPLASLPDALARLQRAGWCTGKIDEHDRRYYEAWSHEAPPMSHPLHRIELDVHHDILPPVARTRVDARMLLSRLRPSRWGSWQVFDPPDQVLHSAAHLFLDSEVRDRLRDLVDIDGLLRHFGGTPAFWQQLPARAVELGLGEQLALALHYCQHWLATPVPEDASQEIASNGPSAYRRAWLLQLLSTVLTPTEPDALPARSQGVAAAVLLARYHLHRMPLRLLVPHLWHKLRSTQHAEQPPA